MDTTKIINFDDNEYFDAYDVFVFNSAFFYGCGNNPRNIIDKKKVDIDNYAWAYIKNKKWIPSTKSYSRAKLLLKKEWCENNIPDFVENNNVIADIEKLPPLISLEDDEKFKDIDGNIYNVKVRGVRNIDECYFSVNDIGEAFGLKDLNHNIIDKNNSYILNVHYKYFTFEKILSKEKNKSKIKIYKTTYFTYKGLIRCLYVSRSGKAEQFQDWATKILFTHQFGTKQDKQQLASSLLGVHADAVKQVFKASSVTVPCVYFFTLGKVKDLRKAMNIDQKYNDEMIICKYGKTESLERRTTEHINTYGSIEGSNLCLKYYSYIDPKYITKGENYISNYMNDINAHIEYNNHTELVVLDSKKLKDTISNQFIAISKMYSGNITELLNKIKNLEDELILEKEKNKRALIEKDNELLQKDNKILSQDKKIMELEKDKKINELEKLLLEKKRN